MDELRRQVQRARWWLGVQRFLRALGWCCFATLLVAATLIGIDKYRSLGVEPWGWAVGAVGLGFVLAAGWAFFRGRGPVDAALEIDRRFGLKERVSSTLTLSDDERETEAGQALVADAVHRVGQIDLAEQFAVAPGRQILLPLAPALVAFLVALLVPAAGENPVEGKTDPDAARRQVEKSRQSLQIKLAEKRERAKREGLEDAQKLFLRLEQDLDPSKLEGDKKDALAKLHDLAEKLEKRRQEMGGADNLEKQLEQLKNFGQGPAEKVLAALAKGDMKLAMKELEKLKNDLAEGKLNQEQQQALAKQLGQVQKKMQNLADAHRKAQQEVKEQLDKAKKAGDQGQVDKLQEQLRKLQEQAPQMEQLQDLAQKLGQCAKCLEGGQTGEAAKMLEQMAGDLEGLDQKLEEFKMLKEAMDELDAARQKMLCDKCGGKGCEACGGDGEGEGGMGLGKGRGSGARPEEETPYETRATRTPPKVRPGEGMVVGEVEGPTVKGDVQQELIEQVQAAKKQNDDPLSEQRMTRKHRQHAQEYFDRFREK